MLDGVDSRILSWQEYDLLVKLRTSVIDEILLLVGRSTPHEAEKPTEAKTR